MSTSRMLLHIIILLPLLLPVQATADHRSILTVEDFQYEYSPTGVPNFNMYITNQSGEVIENPRVEITFSQAIPTRLDDYKYERRGTTRSNSHIVLIPYKRVLISTNTNELLKAGEYEAVVKITILGKKETNRFEFSVHPADIQAAKYQMTANNIQLPTRGETPLWIWLIGSCICVGIIITGVQLVRKMQ